MKLLPFIIFFLPFIIKAHPGIGIVTDSKGNIYYTDLERVWKITDGKITVVIPRVHTHELYIDKHDNLYGEGGYYDEAANKFYHYLWVYRTNGQIDTVMGMRQAYVDQDFSLARDRSGYEYYTRQFLTDPDTSHIYRKAPGGKETILARGNFKGVKWLHPQDDGSVLYVLKNALYRVDTAGNIRLVKEKIAGTKPSFKFSGNSITIWGVWQDKPGNIYLAVFSDQAVKKLVGRGNLTVVYKSAGGWAPLHGVFDRDGNLWVLESSDKNEVRVTRVETCSAATDRGSSEPLLYAIVGCTVLAIGFYYLRARPLQRMKL